MTAVEWLAETMDYLIPSDKELLILQIVKQAKEMERQQIMDAYQQGFNNAYFSNPLSKEQYYNEQFKNK